VNALDAIIVTAALLAASGGYRLGFLRRAGSWLGLAAGAAVGAVALPGVLGAFGPQGDRQVLLVVAVGVLVVCAFAGQAVGAMVGSRLHLVLPAGAARRVDSATGAVAGLLGVLAAVWLLAPAVADVPDWPARQARTSRLVRAVGGFLPEPPDTTRALRRVVGERYPQVLAGLRPAPRLGPPPSGTGLNARTVARVVRSTVKVSGQACDRIQEGSGFVVAPSLVVTNAHVVAGERRTRLERSDGTTVAATVVGFDPARDLALLRAPALDRSPLPLGSIDAGGRGAVFGHPGGGPLRLAPFRVADRTSATGSDIYDRAVVRREVLFLSAALRPGDSGSALTDQNGRVVGVAFAIAPDRPGVAYALSVNELRAVLSSPHASSVATGSCLA